MRTSSIYATPGGAVWTLEMQNGYELRIERRFCALGAQLKSTRAKDHASLTLHSQVQKVERKVCGSWLK